MNLQKSYIVVQNFMKQCNLRGLPRAQRVLAAFKVIPGSLRIKSTTQKQYQLAPHFADPCLPTVSNHSLPLDLSAMTAPSSTCHVFI